LNKEHDVISLVSNEESFDSKKKKLSSTPREQAAAYNTLIHNIDTDLNDKMT
jgi:hypothetical protein